MEQHVAQAVPTSAGMISTGTGGRLAGGVSYRWKIQQAAHYILNDTIVTSLG